MREVQIDKKQYITQKSQLEGDTLFLEGLTGAGRNAFIMYCHGTEWLTDRYKLVMQVFMQLRGKIERLYMCLPLSLIEKLKRYGQKLEIDDSVIFLETAECEFISYEDENSICIEVNNDLKEVFIVGESSKIISADVLTLLKVVGEKVEKWRRLSMKFDGKYIASKILEYRKEMVVSNSVLFLNDYENGINKDAMAVLIYLSDLEEFENWNFIWTLPWDYKKNKEESFPDKIDSKRVECILEDTDIYLLKLSTSEWIVTTKCLPDYFIKRPEQKVFGCFGDGEKYQFEDTVSNLRALFTITMSKLDFLYTSLARPKVFSGILVEGVLPRSIFDQSDAYLEEYGKPEAYLLREEVYQQLENVFCSKEVGSADLLDGENKVLFIIPGNRIYLVWNLFHFIEPQTEVHILLRSSDQGKCWKEGWTLDEEIPLFCKIGACQAEEKGVYTDMELEQDWKRMIGSQHYDKVVAWDNDDVLWNKLYEKAPANQVVRKWGAYFLDEILNVFYNPFLKSLLANKITIQEVSIDGRLYYDLGQDANQNVMLLREKKSVEEWILFYVEKKDIEYNEELLSHLCEENKDCSIAVLDPYKFLQKSDMIRQDNIYFLPTEFVPIKLALAAKKAWVEKNGSLREVLGYLSVPLLPEVDNVADMKLTGDGKILAVKPSTEEADLLCVRKA